MTSEELKKLLLKSQDSNTVSNQTIVGDVELFADFGANDTTFQYCRFQGDLKLESLSIGVRLNFKNCEFDSEIILSNCSSKKEKSLGEHSIYFESCTAGFVKFIGKNNFNWGIHFNASKVKSISVASIITLGSFEVSNGTVLENDIEIIGSQFDSGLKINTSSVINGNVSIENSKLKSIIFNQVKVQGACNLYKAKLNSLTFNKCTVSDEVNIFDIQDVEIVSFKDSIFLKHVQFEPKLSGAQSQIVNSGSLKPYLSLETTSFEGDLIIDGRNLPFSIITINCSARLIGSIFLYRCDIREIELKGYNTSSYIILDKCTIRDLRFEAFYNLNRVSIISPEILLSNSKLKIDNSVMGRTHFVDVNFDRFKQVEIYGSVLSEIVTASVKWFKSEILNSAKRESSDFAHYKQRREIFRQLKLANEKDGNRIDALKFKSFEIRELKNEYFASENSENPKNINDKIILLLSQTNNFGLNWLKPSILLAICAVIGYVGIISLSSLNNFEFRTYLCSLYRNSSLLPLLINPIHSIEATLANDDSLTLNFWVQLFDTFMKIISAFLIFQIISAFRKFLKS